MLVTALKQKGLFLFLLCHVILGKMKYTFHHFTLFRAKTPCTRDFSSNARVDGVKTKVENGVLTVFGSKPRIIKSLPESPRT